jgi:hypothetical protein
MNRQPPEARRVRDTALAGLAISVVAALTGGLVAAAPASATADREAPAVAASLLNSTGGAAAGAGASAAALPRAAAGTATGDTRSAGRPKIHGEVGPSFTISVDPESVPAGKYKLVVQDKGTLHNFHIFGPGGLDKETKVPFTGKKVFKITLQEGTYTVQCVTFGVAPQRVSPHRGFAGVVGPTPGLS